jgi:hypothetical protein
MSLAETKKMSTDIGKQLGASEARIAASNMAINVGADIAAKLAEQGKGKEAAAVAEASIIISTAILTK